ncbi:MAG: UDP-2,3-diacylglucosamine hydrolase [Bacteroidales bacterium 45-6]|nr:MAG: UDP-2,3-diacylglucosamine hydrolase [Bacteroidales bacterium 45-6]
MKKIYFLSDAHLGTPFYKKTTQKDSTVIALPNKAVGARKPVSHEIERKLCRWLDQVKEDAEAIYLLGDLFDYWFDYKNVVPRGFTRFLGKISELTDAGIEVHFFIGNHDIWLTDYFEQECGMIVHRESLVKDFNGKKFFLAHGDGLGDDSRMFKFLRSLFHNKLCRKLFAGIHPRWTVAFAHSWSQHNRATGEMVEYLGEDKEHLVKFAKRHLKMAPNINFFVFGHRHIMLDLMISPACRVAILGDWIRYYSYGVYDGENFSLELFEAEE